MARLECMFKIKVTAARTLWRRRTARERNVVCLVAMLSSAIWRSGKQWSLGEESRSRWLGLSCRCDDRSQGSNPEGFSFTCHFWAASILRSPSVVAQSKHDALEMESIPKICKFLVSQKSDSWIRIQPPWG